jgi:serine/threonine protein kinase
MTLLLAPGELVGDWEVVGKVGVGTYSEIYEAVHVLSRTRAAVKVDRPGPRPDSLAWESGILHKLQRYPFVARHYGLLDTGGGGARPQPMKALVMQLLGSNVSYLRKRQPDGLLPFGAALHAGLQMLALVEAVHAEGFIHRDVKPSNFVLAAAVPTSSKQPGARRLCILDFGQSRVYRDDKGDVRCVSGRGASAGGGREGGGGGRAAWGSGALVLRRRARRPDQRVVPAPRG